MTRPFATLTCAPGWIAHDWTVTLSWIGPPYPADVLYYTCDRCGRIAVQRERHPYP